MDHAAFPMNDFDTRVVAMIWARDHSRHTGVTVYVNRKNGRYFCEVIEGYDCVHKSYGVRRQVSAA